MKSNTNLKCEPDFIDVNLGDLSLVHVGFEADQTEKRKQFITGLVS